MNGNEPLCPGSRIAVGKEASVEAVICSIRPKRVEVVYLDPCNRAMHREVEWMGTHWGFVDKDGPAKPADKDLRLEPYVKALRAKH